MQQYINNIVKATVVHNAVFLLILLFALVIIIIIAIRFTYVVPVSGTRLLNKDVNVLDSVGNPQSLP